jgi:hypothetical protein
MLKRFLITFYIITSYINSGLRFLTSSKGDKSPLSSKSDKLNKARRSVIKFIPLFARFS